MPQLIAQTNADARPLDDGNQEPINVQASAGDTLQTVEIEEAMNYSPSDDRSSSN